MLLDNKKKKRRAIYKKIARLHKLSINQGFLSTLGEPFLALLYEAIDSDPNSILLTEEINGKILGFLAGGKNMKYVYLQMLRQSPRLITALLPEIIKPKKLIGMLELVWFLFKKKTNVETKMPELFSIAVLHSERSKGIAKRLYKSFSRGLSQNGESAFCILVGDNLDSAHQFYLKMGAVPIRRIYVHKGSSSTMYKQNLSIFN